MARHKKIILPKYQQVAIEIAERIDSNYYKVGDKVHARSTLANTFSVSPETARKAVNILVDVGIMEAKHGSGVIVASKDKATSFLSQYKDVQNIEEIKQDLLTHIQKQKKELDELTDLANLLVSQTKKINHANPLLPSELLLTKEAKYLNQTIKDLNLWQETSATVVAILHDQQLLISPGPYAKITAGDILYFIGDEFSKQRLSNFFYPSES
ncbi:TrkA C-terminal domain-containing protein [Vagococcus luciliae]|uniref:GntR family transcriptional regulator n=1 Tax=Vagococcus luciliae TaxID=2920380 RepID=A0ABY5NZA5_9ENTE|nr:TrkA C-terminal domain-containing protein [Vagococcus luciliae]UUV98986.1 hypothetical protein G314FT_11440 [Vagococcus luciliae]